MNRIRRAATTLMVATGALALSVPLAIADDSGQKNGRFTAGADGIGDPYVPLAGNGGYDVEHYDITGTYQPSSDVWTATTEITAKATADLYRFNLDLVGMDVDSVVVNDKPAAWSQTDTELILVPQKKVKTGEPLVVSVTYSGVPHEFLLPVPGFVVRTGFMATDDGANVAGQPDVAAGWFPVNDHPLDKASYRFVVTVPDDVGVVANGFLTDQSTSGDWRTFTWEADEPMASYLATIDIGEWDVREWTTESGLPVYDAVDPDLVADPFYGPSIDASLARQGEVVDVLAARFGPYPFSTVGAIVDDQDDLFFALETQTRPVYSKYFWPDGGDFVVAHELAHQWFGDDVALARWQDIWLNEGPATYAEWIWGEHEGFFTAQDVFDAIMVGDGIPADDPFWELTIGAPPADDLFNGAVYLRGGLTLQALRQEVGDDAFWEIVQTWASDHSGGHGTTPQFIALAEEISGLDLDDLFEAWLFTPAKPAVGAAAAALSSGSTADAVPNAEVSSWIDRSERLRAITRY